MDSPFSISVSPSTVAGQLVAPPSKSMMQRACAMALLHRGTTRIHNPGFSNDDRAALRIIQDFGVTTSAPDTASEVRQELLVLESSGWPKATPIIHAGESGLSIRLFTPIAALLDTPVTITGSGSLVNRPMDFLEQVLPAWGVRVQTTDGKLPIEVLGPLLPKSITVDGSLSSQFVSGLLVAAAASTQQPMVLEVENPTSKPYIDLTLEMLELSGFSVHHEAYRTYHIQPKPADQPPVLDLTITGDWSGAAFPLVAAAIAGEVTLTGLDMFSKQADRQILQALMAAEAILSIQPDRVICRKNNLKAFHFNATDCPDLFPPLAVLAACAAGTSVIEGTERLAHKESNRALTIQTELGKLGVPVLLQDNLMVITGGQSIQSATVSSCQDHRIAMAAAVLALRADGPVTITGAEAVNKSYPHFYDDLVRLGVPVSKLETL